MDPGWLLNYYKDSDVSNAKQLNWSMKLEFIFDMFIVWSSKTNLLAKCKDNNGFFFFCVCLYVCVCLCVLFSYLSKLSPMNIVIIASLFHSSWLTNHEWFDFVHGPSFIWHNLPFFITVTAHRHRLISILANRWICLAREKVVAALPRY